MGKKFDKTKKICESASHSANSRIVVDPSYKLSLPASRLGKIKAIKDALMLKGSESYLAKIAYVLRDEVDKEYSVKDWLNGKTDQELVNVLSNANSDMFDSILSIITGLMSSSNKSNDSASATRSLTHQNNDPVDPANDGGMSLFDILR